VKNRTGCELSSHKTPSQNQLQGFSKKNNQHLHCRTHHSIGSNNSVNIKWCWTNNGYCYGKQGSHFVGGSSSQLSVESGIGLKHIIVQYLEFSVLQFRNVEYKLEVLACRAKLVAASPVSGMQK